MRSFKLATVLRANFFLYTQTPCTEKKARQTATDNNESLYVAFVLKRIRIYGVINLITSRNKRPLPLFTSLS